MQNWKASASTTLIGSLPHKDRPRALEIVFRMSPEIPIWPQLSTYPHEQMMIQYMEGLPGLGDPHGRLHVNTEDPNFDHEVLAIPDGSGDGKDAVRVPVGR